MTPKASRFLNYMHMRLGNGRVTCAIDHPAVAMEEERPPTDSDLVKVGVSFCSPRDIFTKSKGRDKACGRLRTDGPMTFSFYPSMGIPIKAQVRMALQRLIQGDGCVTQKHTVGIPNWALGETLQ